MLQLVLISATRGDVTIRNLFLYKGPRGSAIVFTNNSGLMVVSAAVSRDNNLIQSDWLVYCEVDTWA